MAARARVGSDMGGVVVFNEPEGHAGPGQTTFAGGLGGQFGPGQDDPGVGVDGQFGPGQGEPGIG